MPWDEIKFKISADMDFGNAKAEVDAVKKGIGELKQSFADMPNFTRIMDSSLEKTATVADALGSKLEKLSDKTLSQGERSKLEKEVTNNIGELNAQRNLRTTNTDFSSSMAHAFLGGLPDAIRQELDAITPQISSIIRSRMSSLSKEDAHFKGTNVGSIVRATMKDKEVKDLLSRSLSAEGIYQFDDYLKHLVPHIAASAKLDEYQKQRFGKTLAKTANYFDRGNPIDLFPESFKASFTKGGYSRTNLTAEQLSMAMTPAARQKLDRMFADNPVAVKAALAAGISRRDNRGLLETKEEISREDWERFRASMYDELINRTAGFMDARSKNKNPYQAVAELDRKTLASRLTQSTSGKTMLALHELEQMQNDAEWITATGNRYYRKNYDEARRQLDEYATRKYSPFLPQKKGDPFDRDNAKIVGISESQATRVLGRNQWRNNQDVSDTVSLISLAGYNESDPKQKAALLDLYRNGKTINGIEYVAESTHGKGNDTVVRMIARNALERANQEQAKWARPAGLSGTYFGGFSDDIIAQKIADGSMDTVAWGKYLESANKKWTPSSNLGVKSDNIKIAVVDMQGTLGDKKDFEFGDGAMWVSNMLMRDSAQARIGVGGKGSAFVYQGENNGALFQKWGLLDENGRAWAKGANGEKIDITDANVILPTSMLKNKMAYMQKNEDGTYSYRPDISNMVTAEARNLGIGEVVNYEKEDQRSDNLGTQAMSFLNFSPAVRMHQIALAKKRLQELDTEEGQLKYVFSGNDDWFSKQITNNPHLLATEQAQAWVDNYKTRLVQDLASGKFIDFGDSDSKFSNVRAAANPLAAMLMSQYGGITPEVLSKAREYIAKDAKERGVEAPQYTDKEIEDLILLKSGNAVDFAHENQESITLLRSPMGYGNILNVKNRAKEARSLYEGFGIIEKGSRGPGVYASEEDRPVLQGFDYDADQFKVVYDPALVKEIQEISKLQEFKEYKAQTEDIKLENVKDAAAVKTDIAGLKQKMQLEMGSGSAGTRAMQLDLSDPENRRFIAGAQMMQSLYDVATTKDKSPKNAVVPDAVWDTLKLGKEYTKFSDHVHELFRFDDDQLDENGEVDLTNKDVFRAKNGQLINMRNLRAMGVDNINAPSVNMASHVMGVGLANQLYQLGMSDTTRWDAVAEAMDELDYGTAGPHRQALMKAMRHMLPEWSSGKRGRLTDEEDAAIGTLINNAREELKEEANRSYNAETKTFDSADSSYKDANAYVEGEAKKYSIRIAENMRNLFGFTKQNGAAKLGETFKDFVNSGTASFLNETLEADQRERNEIVQEILDLQEQREQERAAAEEQVNQSRNKTRGKGKPRPQQSDSTRFGPGAADQSDKQRTVPALAQAANANIPQTATEQRIVELQDRLSTLDQKTEHRNAMLLKHNQIMSDAREASQQLWISQQGHANKIDDKTSLARAYWNRQFYGIAKPQFDLLDAQAVEINQDDAFSEKEKNALRTEIQNQKQDIKRNLNKDFVNKAIEYTKDVAEDIEKEVDKIENEPSTQKKRLNNIDKQMKESRSFEEEIRKKMNSRDSILSQEEQDLFGYGLKNVQQRIRQQEDARIDLVSLYTKENEQEAREAMETLQGQLGYRDKNSLEVQLQNRRKLIQDRRDAITKNHSEKLMSDNFYNEQMALLAQYDEQAESDIIRNNRLALGLDQQTPQEKADEWAKKRIDLIDASNKLAMDEAHDRWLKGGSYDEYVAAQKKYYLGVDDVEKERINKQAAQMVTFGAEMQKLASDSQMAGVKRQNDVMLRNQERQYDRYDQNRASRFSNSRLYQYYMQDENHRKDLEDSITSYRNNIASEQENIAKWEKQLTFEGRNKSQDQTILGNIDAAKERISGYQNALNAAESAQKNFSQSANAMNAVLGTAGQKLQQVARYLGRQLFAAARKETVQFVKEFDSSMNEIQAITMKSGDQMQSVRSDTINKALGLRTSVSNVANVEAALYRQGLSDEEVSSRTESIIKFATVTKLNVTEATKIITTALQNDLVPSAEAAMDALVALGDSAATTAAEIGKGMQKAAASAKVAGVSYAELTALLTIGTSDTQLSGTQVGTALQTVFSRMRRLSMSGYTAEQNGEKTTASDAEAALKAVGVDLWDDKSIGKMRTAYDVLSDLSKVWQQLSDAQKNIVMNALAGTRQTNVFSTLMEGMSEDGGATLDKYLGLASSSEGITQSKYEIAMQSLSASMNELKSSWDAVVASFTNSGVITGVLDGVSDFLQTISNTGGVEQGFAVIIGGIAGISAALLALKAQNPALAALAGTIAIITGLATGGGIAAIAGALKGETESQRFSRIESENLGKASHQAEIRNKDLSSKQSAIKDVQELGKEYDRIKDIGTAAEKAMASDRLIASLNGLKSAFPEVSSVILKAIQDLNGWKDAVEAAAAAGEKYSRDNVMAAANDIAFAHAQYAQDQIKYESKAKVLDNSRADEIAYTMAYSADDYQWGKKYRDEQGYFDLDKFLKEGQSGEKARFLEDLVVDNTSSDSDKAVINDYLNTYFKGVYDDILDSKTAVSTSSKEVIDAYASAADGLIKYITNNQEETEETQGEVTFITGKISSLVADYSESFKGMANEEHTADEIETMLARDIVNQVYTDGQKNSEFFNEDGSLNVSAIDKAITSFIGEWVNNPNSKTINNLVDNNKKLSEYAYTVGDKGFDNYEDAAKYANQNNIKRDEIKDKNGNSVYQTTQQLLEASVLQANENNKQRILDSLVRGVEVENESKTLAAALSGGDQNAYNDWLRLISNGGLTVEQLTEEQLRAYKAQAPVKDRITKPLNEYTNFEQLFEDYNNKGLSSYIQSYIANTPEVLSAYLMGDFDLFRNTLETSQAGKSTVKSQADIAQQYMDILRGEGGAAKVKTLRTDAAAAGGYELFKSFFGEQADEILNAIEEGTYETDKDLQAYVRSTLAKKSIKQGTGLKQFTNLDIAKLAQQVLEPGFSSLTEAQEGLTDWTTDEWSAIESKYPSLIRYLQMSPEQRKTQEGQNLQQEYEIQMKVAGVSDLETANRVLEGTTQLIENLQKGGEIEIKAKLSFESQLYNNAQQAALLENGTTAEQIQAIMSITGLSGTQIQSDLKGSKEIAEQLISGQRGITAASLQEIARTIGPAYAQELAEKYGYVSSGAIGEQDALQYINDFFHYTGTSNAYQFDSETGELYSISPYGNRMAASETANRIFREQAYGTYTWGGKTPEPTHENAAFGAKRERSSVELAKAMDDYVEQLHNGTFNLSKNADLYNTAYSAMGASAKNYVAMVNENKESIALNGTEKYSKADLDAAYQSAKREVNESFSSAFNNTFASAFDYRRASQAYGDLSRQENRQTFASLTGMSEDRIKELYDQGNFKALEAELKEVYGHLLDDPMMKYISQLANINLEEYGDLDSFIQALREAAQHAQEGISDLITSFANALSQADDAARSYDTTDFSTMLDKAMEGLTHSADREKGLKWMMDNLGEAESRVQAGKSNNLYYALAGMAEGGEATRIAWDSVMSDPKFAAAAQAWSQGTFSTEQFKDYLESSFYGTENTARYENDLRRAVFNNPELQNNTGYQFITDTGRFNTELFKSGSVEDQIAALQSLKAAYDQLATTEGIKEFVNDIGGLNEVIQLISNEDYDTAKKALERLNEEMNKKESDQASKYSKELKNTAEAIALIKNGGKDAKVGTAMINKELKNLQNQAAAVKKVMGGMSGEDMKQARKKDGDRTSELLANLIGYSVEDIEDMSSSQLQSIFDSDFMSGLDETFTSAIQDMINSVLEGQEINVDMDQLLKIHPDGQVDLSEFAAACEGTAGRILAQIAAMAKNYGSVTLDVQENGNIISVVGKLNAGGGSTAGSGGGGGGGGGKSKVDKLLDEQKHKIVELEHNLKMLEIKEKELDFTNSYSAWDDNIDDQIEAQRRLQQQYSANISEMKAMLGTLKSGSDDWYKLKEAIMEAQESLAEINNTIDELNHKRIDILSQKQENADKPDSHLLTMIQKRADRYQKSDQFEGYSAMMQESIAVTRRQIEQNNNQIKEWEDLLKTYEENSDSWIETRDNIWALREENAEMENQIASDLIDLQDAKIAQIAQDLQNQKTPFEHAETMLQTYGEMYQTLNNQAGYREALSGIIDSNMQLKTLNDAAIEELRKEIDGMSESDPSRQNAIETLYQLEEASAQYEASILSNRQAIEESLVNELKDSHDQATTNLDHEKNLLAEAEKGFHRDDDFLNYENILNEEARNAAERIEEQRHALEDYIGLQKSGQITEGTEQWKTLDEAIRSARENIAAYTNEYEELIDKIQTARFEDMQKTFNETDDLAQHNLKMIQYEETRYQNRGELTNYGTLLSQDTEMQRERAANIQEYLENLKDMQEEVEDNPELYKKITQEIYKYEEQLSNLNNTIEKNEELLKKNAEAIRKVRKAVEDTVDKEIRARIQKERNMLAATVQVENSILDVIRKNYQTQWNLEKKTLNLKKQSLNEEKALINERLNARKNAINEEQKYEELAEYQRQLALITADTTRTKEQAELRRKISEIQKDISWDLAQDEANAQVESIDDQIKAIDSYVSTYEEDLNELLSDANNFREDLDDIMGGSFEDFVGWMKENNESYKNATEEARQQMEQGWEDTWKKMKGEIDTYWEEVDESMRSREGFLAYMQNSDTYKAASETGQQSLLYQWGEMYDKYTASLVDNAEFDHTHELLSKVDELKDWTFNVNIAGLSDYLIDQNYSDYVYNRRRDYDEFEADPDYVGTGAEVKRQTPLEQAREAARRAGRMREPTPEDLAKLYSIAEITMKKENPTNAEILAEGKGPLDTTDRFLADSLTDPTFIQDTVTGKTIRPINEDKLFYNDYERFRNGEMNQDPLLGGLTSISEKREDTLQKLGNELQDLTATANNLVAVSSRNLQQDIDNGGLSLRQYASGGLVDYTGPAWVDGTKSRPESFLDATDTSLLRNMLDAFTYVKQTPYMTTVDQSNFGKGDVNVGDVNVNLYEAKLEDDADYNLIAKKVGDAFTKELQKDGFNLAGYAW